MARLRMVSFGYWIENGEISAHPVESKVVVRIFKEYLNGKSLRDVAKQMEVPYAEGVDWTPQRICMVLDNQKYLGTEHYPKLIDPELFQTVQTMKSSRTRNRVEMPEDVLAVRKMTICNECGGRIYRYGGRQFKGWWDCNNPECSKLPVRLTDEVMFTAVLNALNAVIENPGLLDRDIPETDYHPTGEIVRQRNEIRRMMENPTIEYDRIKAEIYNLAEMKYHCCEYSDVPHKTERLKALLAEKQKMNTLDIGLLESCVSRVLVSHSCTIEVEFINGTIINERGETA